MLALLQVIHQWKAVREIYLSALHGVMVRGSVETVFSNPV